MNITEKLLRISTELKAPKNQRNNFGNYNYRSAEDILEALKPHLKKLKCVLKMHDELKIVGDYPYIEATAKLIDCEESHMQIESSAQAVLDFNAKGMQHPQRTGSASSYAKKYAMGNLFLLDDTKDSDATNQHNSKEQKSVSNKKVVNNKELPTLAKGSEKFIKAIDYLKGGGSIDKIFTQYRMSKVVQRELEEVITK